MCNVIDDGFSNGQMTLKILPNTKRLKQLIKEFGYTWNIIKYNKNVQCLGCSGFFIESLCNIHKRWIEESNIKLDGIKINKFPNWFGKGCDFFNGIWEENEITGGPNYKEYEPDINHCSHHRNYSETEGNCRKERCPLNKSI